MPDIAMCNREDCDIRHRCKRSPKSGTKPAEIGQAWIFWTQEMRQAGCDWPILPGDPDE